MHKQHNPYLENLKHEQDELAIQYLPAIRAMAFRLKERLPASVDVNDLISIATEELLKLARRYDSSLNDNFWGYARKRVNGAMLDYLRSLDTVSRSNRKIIKDMQILIDEYVNEFDEEPNDEYLAEKLEVDVDKIREAKLSKALNYVLPLDEQIDMYREDSEDIVEKISKEDMLEKVMEALSECNEREQLIIQLYFYEELSLKEISNILGISESRISQIQSKVFNLIRKKVANG